MAYDSSIGKTVHNLPTREYRDIVEVNDQPFTVVRRIGGGAFGNVYEVTDAEGKTYALKESYERNVEKLAEGCQAMMEYVVLADEAKPHEWTHFPKVYACEVDSNTQTMLLVMEMIRGESVDSLISKSYFSSPERKHSAICQMTEILQQLHDNSITHMDIKSDNLVLKKDGTLVLVDFGFTCTTSAWYKCAYSPKCQCNLRNYNPKYYGPGKDWEAFVAPEYYQDQLFPYGLDAHKVDVYHAGIVLMQILRGNTNKFTYGYVQQICEFNTNVFVNAVCEMLSRDPSQRPSGAQLWEMIKDACTVKRTPKRKMTAITSSVSPWAKQFMEPRSKRTRMLSDAEMPVGGGGYV